MLPNRINGIFICMDNIPTSVNSTLDILSACIVAHNEQDDKDLTEFRHYTINNGGGVSLNVISFYIQETGYLSFTCELKNNETSPGLFV